MDSNPQSSGICQRLLRLILGVLRRPSALPAASTHVLVEEGPSRKGKDSLSSDVVVEFRHTTDGLIVSDDQTIVQNGVDKKGRSKFDQKNGAQGKGKGVKKSVTIMESERKEEGNHHHQADHPPTVDDQLQDDTKSRRHWPLLSVASNINEKSEEFIEKKKKAMNRNYSLDQDQKK